MSGQRSREDGTPAERNRKPSEKGEAAAEDGGKLTENGAEPRESRWRRIHRIVRRVWIGGGIVFTGWLVWSFQAHGLPAGTFESDARVAVDRGSESIRFRPVDEAIRARPVEQEAHAAGLVFLPGGMVDPRAYGPLARRLAEAGQPVAIVEHNTQRHVTLPVNTETTGLRFVLVETWGGEASDVYGMFVDSPTPPAPRSRNISE